MEFPEPRAIHAQTSSPVRRDDSPDVKRANRVPIDGVDASVFKHSIHDPDAVYNLDQGGMPIAKHYPGL